MQVLDGIERRYNRPQTMEFQFEQSYAGHGRRSRTESGRLFLRKPGRMRWEYGVPEGKLFVADGKDAYFYSPAAHRVEKTKLKETGDLRAPFAFLMGRLDFRRDFREFRTRPEGEFLHVEALPKSDRSPYTKVVFVVSASHQIHRLVVTGTDQSVMEFRFAGEKLNPSLNDSLFRFVAPAGAELVEVSELEGEQR